MWGRGNRRNISGCDFRVSKVSGKFSFYLFPLLVYRTRKKKRDKVWFSRIARHFSFQSFFPFHFSIFIFFPSSFFLPFKWGGKIRETRLVRQFPKFFVFVSAQLWRTTCEKEPMNGYRYRGWQRKRLKTFPKPCPILNFFIAFLQPPKRETLNSMLTIFSRLFSPRC